MSPSNPTNNQSPVRLSAVLLLLYFADSMDGDDDPKFYTEAVTDHLVEAYPPVMKAKSDIEALIRQAQGEAVYGFHEFILGKDIIQNETDQAFNYARLHRALDDYIAELEQPNPERKPSK